jgi:hypothetical protein
LRSVPPRIAATDSKHGRALFEADANAKKEMDFVRGGHHGGRALALIQK